MVIHGPKSRVTKRKSRHLTCSIECSHGIRRIRMPIYCRGVILERLGLLGRAHAEFQAVVDQDPNDAHAWEMLGSTLRVSEPEIPFGAVILRRLERS